MAITVGQATADYDQENQDPYQFNHDNDTNDFILVAGAQETSGGSDLIPATGSTYGGDAVTAIGDHEEQSQIKSSRWFYKVSPKTEVNQVSIDFGGPESDDMGWAVSFSGVDATSPIGTEKVVKGSGTNHSTDFTSTVANSMLVAWIMHEDEESITENSGEGWILQTDGSAGSQMRVQVLTLLTTSVATYDISWSAAEDDYLIRIIELLPASEGGATLELPLLSASTTLYAPTVSPGNIDLALPLLSASTTLYAPSIGLNLDLALPLLTNTPTLHAPTVAVGNIDLALPLLSNTAVLHAPSLALNLDIQAPLLAAATSLHAPTVAVGNIDLALPLLSASTTLYAPTVTLDTAILELPLLSNTAVLHAPSLALNLDIQAPLLAAATSLHAPTLSMGNINLALPLIASASTLHAPTVSAGNIDLSLPLIASTTTLYAPSLALNLDLALPLIASTTTLHTPSVSVGNINAQLPLLSASVTLHTPTVSPGNIDLSLPLLTVSTTLYAPVVIPSLKIFEDDMVVGSNENLDDHVMDLPVSESWTNLQGQTIVVRESDDVAVMADQAGNEWVVYIADTTNFSDEKQYAEADVASTDGSAQNARMGVGCRMVSDGANDKGIFGVLRGELSGTRRVSLYLMTDDATIDLPNGGSSETTFAWLDDTTYRIRLEVRNLPTANNVRAKIFVDDVLIHTETFVDSDIYSNNGRPGIIGRVATSWGPTDENTLTNFEAGYVGAELELPLLTNAPTLYAPEVLVGLDVNLELPLLASTTALYAPSITFPLTLEMPVISGGTSLFAPTLLPGAISVTLPFLSASSVLYAPVLTFVWNDVDNPSSPIWANVDSVTTPSYGDVDSPTTPTWEDVD